MNIDFIHAEGPSGKEDQKRRTKGASTLYAMIASGADEEREAIEDSAETLR